MEIRQIEYVVGVVEQGGFTRAAEALHVTQPALSEGIRRLEAELGLELFRRVGRRALLSSAGEAFLEPARQVLRDLGVLRTSVEAVGGLTAGTLDVVALPTLAVDPLATLVGSFRHAHPDVVVRVDQPEDAAAVATRVRSGRSEIGLTELPVAEPGLVSRHLTEQELIVVLPPDSPLARRRRLTTADLASVPLVTSPPGTSTRGLIAAAFGAIDRAHLARRARVAGRARVHRCRRADQPSPTKNSAQPEAIRQLITGRPSAPIATTCQRMVRNARRTWSTNSSGCSHAAK